MNHTTACNLPVKYDVCDGIWLIISLVVVIMIGTGQSTVE
jgi:hypothetical protein